MTGWAHPGPVLEVLDPGPLTTIQDLGRPGFAHLGVPRSGAADRNSLRRANLLLGNSPDAPALETTLAGPSLLATDGAIPFTLTGAPADATIDGQPVTHDTPTLLPDGTTLTLGPATAGVHTYIAVTGGILVPRTLTSAAHDVLSGLGPPPLKKRDQLLTGGGAPAGAPPLPGHHQLPPPTPFPTEPILVVTLGPDLDHFDEEAVAILLGGSFTVSQRSNRVGLRLEGPSLPKRGSDERTSVGLAHGSLQVPHGGEPILMGADHPTTGGYPVIAVLADGQGDIAGQLRPGQRVRFATVDGPPPAAHH